MRLMMTQTQLGDSSFCILLSALQMTEQRRESCGVFDFMSSRTACSAHTPCTVSHSLCGLCFAFRASAAAVVERKTMPLPVFMFLIIKSISRTSERGSTAENSNDEGDARG